MFKLDGATFTCYVIKAVETKSKVVFRKENRRIGFLRHKKRFSQPEKRGFLKNEKRGFLTEQMKKKVVFLPTRYYEKLKQSKKQHVSKN